jgi:hypothetical protein
MATAAFALAACGGDDDPTGVGNTGDPLNEAEIQEVFTALFGALDAIAFSPPTAPAQAPVTFSQDFQATNAPCETSGTINLIGGVDGTFDDMTGAFDFSFTLTMTPSSCTVPTSSGSITMNGAPNLVFLLDYAGASEDTFTADGSYTGGVSYSTSDGRSGTCQFDVDYSADVDFTTSTIQQSTSGTVCGVSASQFTVVEF